MTCWIHAYTHIIYIIEVLDIFISQLYHFISRVANPPWHWAIQPVLQLLLPFSPLALAPLHQTGGCFFGMHWSWGVMFLPHGSVSPCVPHIIYCIYIYKIILYYIILFYYVCMYVWMDGWMDGWMHGCMDAWMHGWMDGWMDGCMYVWLCMIMYNHMLYIYIWLYYMYDYIICMIILYVWLYYIYDYIIYIYDFIIYMII